MSKKLKVADNYVEVTFDNYMRVHQPMLRVMSPDRHEQLKHAFYEGVATILTGLAYDDEHTIRSILMGAQKELDDYAKERANNVAR